MKFTRFEATMIRGDTEPLSIFLTEEDGKTVIPFAYGNGSPCWRVGTGVST